MTETRRFAGWIVAMLLAATPVSAAEFMHCYLREAPADAPASSTANVSGLLPALQIASLKHACEADTAADQEMLNGLVAAGQCSPESEIAGFVRETFEISPEAAAEDLKTQSSQEVLARLCTAVESCAAGDNGYSDTCQAAIGAAIKG